MKQLWKLEVVAFVLSSRVQSSRCSEIHGLDDTNNNTFDFGHIHKK